MKNSIIGAGLLGAALLGGAASALETDYSAGTRALPLQQAGGTARAMAMASAVVAVPDGSASLLWNPAGLARMSCSEVGLHHNSGLGDVNQETLIAGIPLGKTEEGKGGSWGGLAASVGYVGYGSVAGRDAAGLPTGSYGANELSGSVGWGMNVLPGLAAGIDLKADRASVAGQAGHAFTTGAGLVWNPVDRLDLGASYSNLSLGSRVGGNRPASGWRLGAAWTQQKRWLLAVSGELEDRAVKRVQLGTEYLIGDLDRKAGVLALRAGYQLDIPGPQLSGLTSLTLGLGYTITRGLALDYAMLPNGELGTSHRISLTFKFHCPAKS